MILASNSTLLTAETIGTPATCVEHRWYAAYTCANHEKRVAKQFGDQEMEHFLPLYSSVRRWKDRRVQLELPLFPGYVFVRIALHDRLRILQVPSVVRLVGFGGLPTPLPDDQIEPLRNGLAHGLRAEPHPYLSMGRRVRIKSGPLAGLTGIAVRRKGSFRVVLSVDLLARSVVADVDLCDVEELVDIRF
jgi:transcription antitermination factor NusG